MIMTVHQSWSWRFAVWPLVVMNIDNLIMTDHELDSLIMADYEHWQSDHVWPWTITVWPCMAMNIHSLTMYDHEHSVWLWTFSLIMKIHIQSDRVWPWTFIVLPCMAMNIHSLILNNQVHWPSDHEQLRTCMVINSVTTSVTDRKCSQPRIYGNTGRCFAMMGRKNEYFCCSDLVQLVILQSNCAFKVSMTSFDVRDTSVYLCSYIMCRSAHAVMTWAVSELTSQSELVLYKILPMVI